MKSLAERYLENYMPLIQEFIKNAELLPILDIKEKAVYCQTYQSSLSFLAAIRGPFIGFSFNTNPSWKVIPHYRRCCAGKVAKPISHQISVRRRFTQVRGGSSF